MKKESLINLYPLSKTLKFKLIPIGETENYFEQRKLLEEDKRRSEYFDIAKKVIDRRHKAFIESSLKEFKLDDLNDYACLYLKTARNPEDTQKMDDIADKMRKSIEKNFSSQVVFKKLFSEEMIRELVLEEVKTQEEHDACNSFHNFTTYFMGFHENRKNIYKAEKKSTEVAFRIVDQNLPKFLDNTKLKNKVTNCLSDKDISTLQNNFAYAFDNKELKIFQSEYFNECLNQDGIDKYNQLIGGFTLSSGEKIQGLNEIINLYNQREKEKIPKFKMLYK